MQTILLLLVGVTVCTLGILALFAVLRGLEDRKRERELVFMQILTPKKAKKIRKLSLNNLAQARTSRKCSVSWITCIKCS